jgi:hypothetical protein
VRGISAFETAGPRGSLGAILSDAQERETRTSGFPASGSSHVSFAHGCIGGRSWLAAKGIAPRRAERGALYAPVVVAETTPASISGNGSKLKVGVDIAAPTFDRP